VSVSRRMAIIPLLFHIIGYSSIVLYIISIICSHVLLLEKKKNRKQDDFIYFLE
jgi:hypothetical protein